MNYAQMQSEQEQWLAENFPGQPLHLPLLGVIEEVGEAARCLLKMAQESMHGKEPRYKDRDWHAELVDAIADMGIYLCSACCTARSNFEAVVESAKISAERRMPLTNTKKRDCIIIALIATQASSALSRLVARELWPTSSFTDILVPVIMLAQELQIDFDSAMEATWHTVKARRRKNDEETTNQGRSHGMGD